MKRKNSYLLPMAPLIALLLLLTSIANGVELIESACPQEQLDRLHAHWHTVIMERDPDNRGQLIGEHRLLVDSVGRIEGTGTSEVGPGCQQDATLQRHDLENMLEMHSMMLDMVE